MFTSFETGLIQYGKAFAKRVEVYRNKVVTHDNKNSSENFNSISIRGARILSVFYFFLNAIKIQSVDFIENICSIHFFLTA